MKKASVQARSLWAKKSRSGDLLWLSLLTHLMDTAEVALLLWRKWLPEGVKQKITSGMSKSGDVENLVSLLALLHDLGKATPVFASKECGYYELDERVFDQVVNSGLSLERQSFFFDRNQTPHALASQVLLSEAGCPESVAVVVGAHHGKPPSLVMLSRRTSSYPENYYLGKQGKEGWQAVQRELIEWALLQTGFRELSDLPELDIVAQVLFSGLLITADWIASDEYYFPYMRLDDPALPDSCNRAAAAWAKLEFSYPWEASNSWMSLDLVTERFGHPANEVQQAASQAVADVYKPGIMVIEASMGLGKTEAALLAAEVLAYRTKRRGVFFALPTQATSDGIFPRMVEWVSRLETEESQSIRLLHGKAQLNPEFRDLASGTNIAVDEDIGVYVHEWFVGRKRAMLDDFVVGTIDQLLLAGLKQKHVMLRHLGLANKIVIIDECHAYDAYMSCYLERALNWLGMYGVPVVVLSATLPAEKRQAVIEAYCNNKFWVEESQVMSDPLSRIRKTTSTASAKPAWMENRAYPLITYSDANEVKQISVQSTHVQKQVKLDFLADEAIVVTLGDCLSDGGCAGVIVNSVRRAQEMARLLKQQFGDDQVYLLHSRFLAPDRIAKEVLMMKELGKPRQDRKRPKFRIVVGTQVLEQSLDIDFDVLITDICPIDLLLQRIGRLHRHDRNRPQKLRQAMCWITGVKEDGFDSATTSIYGDYLLMRTKACIGEQLTLPMDIPQRVQDVYDPECPLVPPSEEYQRARQEYNYLIDDKRTKANAFRLGTPKNMKIMIDWLDTDVSDKKGEAAVRDTEDSIEVLLIRRTRAGKVAFLPWIEDGMELDSGREPEPTLARKLASCSVRLPLAVGGRYKDLDDTIQHLEQLNKEQLAAWQQSPWLKGELFLILDEQLSVDFGKYRLIYYPEFGLDFKEREADVDGGNGESRV